MTTQRTTAIEAGPDSQIESDVLRIVDLDDQGRGVARVDGKVTLIDGALTGEKIRIHRRQRRRRLDHAELAEVLEPSPNRVTPSCRHHALCGGCRLQHLSLEAQRERKMRMLADALARYSVPRCEFSLRPIYGGTTGYRRKARLGVRYVAGKGGALVGFREKRKNFVSELDACEVLVSGAGQRIAALRQLISGLDARARIPQIEIAAGENATAFVVRHLDPLSDNDRAAMIDFAIYQGIQLYVQPGGPDSVTPLHPKSPPPLAYAVPEFDLDLAFQPTDFVQVNAEVNRELVAQAVRLLEIEPSDRVLDLFCGIGNFSLAIARRAAQVSGVEYSTEMVSAANINAATNGIRNARFSRLDLTDTDAVASELMQGWNKLLLDPPRSGAESVVSALGSPYPSRVVYVSCNPDTFARDASQLVTRHGYHFESAGIVDMFPHTSHVEVIGAFARLND